MSRLLRRGGDLFEHQPEKGTTLVILVKALHRGVSKIPEFEELLGQNTTVDFLRQFSNTSLAHGGFANHLNDSFGCLLCNGLVVKRKHLLVGVIKQKTENENVSIACSKKINSVHVLRSLSFIAEKNKSGSFFPKNVNSTCDSQKTFL